MASACSGRYGLFPIGRAGEHGEKDWMIHRMDPPADPEREPMPERSTPMLAGAGDAARTTQRRGPSRSSGTGSGRSPTSSRGGCGWRAATSTTSPRPIRRSAGSCATSGCATSCSTARSSPSTTHGRPSFERLQRRMHVTSPSAVRRLATSTPVVYAIFDLLYLDGHSLMGLPYAERRAARSRRSGWRAGLAGAGRASRPGRGAAGGHRGPGAGGDRGQAPGLAV